MKKKISVLGVAVLVGVLALTGVAQSAMWVGAQIGGNFNSADLHASVGPASGSTNIFLKPSVIGGATLGYDFVNAGFGAYAWPDWMKYFSFAMDLTYNRLTASSLGSGGGFNALAPNSRLNGYEVAWTFLFMGHYGFLPDSEVPTGRIVPYIGVGPALVWSGADGTLNVRQPAGNDTRFHSRFSDNVMNVALVVEPGIRWMCFKNVSVDTAFRYRYSVPTWGATNNVDLKLTLHQFAFLLRANYHF
jgi:opacity protein-like surface antigen